MKGKVILLSFLLGYFCFGFVSADEYLNGNLKVSVDIKEPFALIDISPTNIHLGEITKGYESEVHKITATNLGTLDVRISPSLKYDAPDFFNYVKFSSASCSSWSNLTKWTSSIIYGQNKSGDRYDFCMKLDLSSYEDPIEQDMLNLATDITFIAMPA